MKKPIIGIISGRMNNDERPFKSYTSFTNNFGKRIIRAGGVPVGILFPDGKFNYDVMNMCDGFLFQGGSVIENVQINAVHYAIEKNKPVLAICLGMQTLAGYEWFSKKYGSLTYELIEENFSPNDEVYFLHKKEGHNNLEPFYIKNINKAKHNIIISDDSKLFSIFNEKFLNEPSIHSYVVEENILENSKFFNIVGRSNDGIIEAIEGKTGWIMGVQFHPELEDKNQKLFDSFIENARKK